MKLFLMFHLTISTLAIVIRDPNSSSTLPPLGSVKRLRYRIVGGRPAYKNEFPPIVNLSRQYRETLESFCSGSIVHPQWVITAATCVDWIARPALRNTLMIRSDIIDLDPREDPEPGSANYSVVLAKIHPEFNNAFWLSDNVALLKVNGAFRTDQIATVLSTDDNEFIPVHAVVTSFGWGLTDPLDPFSASRFLLKVNNEISPKYCFRPDEDQHLRSIRRHQQVCVASFADRGICDMDIGGPLIFGPDKVLFGVASSMDTPCGSDRGRFARVSHYIPWIEKTIGAKLKKRSAAATLEPSASALVLTIVYFVARIAL